MRQHYVTVVHKEANSDFRAYFPGLPWRCHHLVLPLFDRTPGYVA
jgi:hypothetical protein